MNRLIVIALLALAAVAAADAFRPASGERAVVRSEAKREPLVIHHAPPPELVAVGGLASESVLRDGREYLSAEAVDAAFPVRLEDVPFDIAYVATSPDGTVALAVYKFPVAGPSLAGLELWRNRKLVRAFSVPAGVFAGGLGFADDGRLVATLSSDGLLVHLFTRDGRAAGRQSATSW